MLHGCTQTAAGFAFASRMNEAADRHGFVVLYPEQSRSANAQSCWNWFVAAQQQRAGVEASFIAAATRTAMHGARWTVDPARVYLVGMSAGGAMASVVAATHPDLYAALAVHSGLAFGCATHLGAARAAMTQGAPDAEELGRAAHRAMGDHAQPVPALVIHGDADRIVCPINGDQVARQWLVTNRLAGGGEADLAFDSPTAVERQHGGARAATRRRWADAGGRLMAEHLLVHGLGHAWSGGAAGGSYTDPHGPSAVDAIWGFFARACHGRAATVG
jgi:poly(hydroxyalkanoate) depolymerase family esterase